MVQKLNCFTGGNTSNKILDTGGLEEVVQGGVTRSFFGSSITIGKTTGNNTSRVEIASDVVNIINRDGSGTESTVLSFDKTGDVVSDNFLLERTRLFGAGGDGDIILLSNSFQLLPVVEQKVQVYQKTHQKFSTNKEREYAQELVQFGHWKVIYMQTT